MRRVITKRDIVTRTRSLDGAGVATADGFATRLVKYIPAETITALGVLQAANYFGNYMIDIAIAAGFNFLYLAVLHRAGVWQVIVSYFAFCVWVLLLGGDKIPLDMIAEAGTLTGLCGAIETTDECVRQVKMAFFPSLALFATLLGPVIDEIGDRFVVNQ
jgi:hypothetical protein